MWVILTILAQLTWALEIFIDEHLLQSSEEDETSGVGRLFLVSCFFGGIVAIALFGAMVALYGFGGTLEHISFEHENLVLALVVGVFEMAWLVPYLYALRFSDAVSAPPIFQTIPVFGFLFGFLFFGEVPDVVHVGAGAVIILGALLLNLELIKEDLDGGKLRLNWQTVSLMLLASVIIAVISFLFKDAAIAENFFGTAFWMSVGSFITGIIVWALVPSYRKDFNALARSTNGKLIRLNVFNETIDSIALLAFNAAIVLGPSTALIQSTAAYQPILLLLFGYLYGKFGSHTHAKKHTGAELLRRSIAIGAIFIGSVLIFL